MSNLPRDLNGGPTPGRRICFLTLRLAPLLICPFLFIGVWPVGNQPQVSWAADVSPIKGIENPENLPLLLDFGRGICIPCRMMKPILEEVAREYEGKLLVRILEIDEFRELKMQFRVRLIPTQIFIDSKGEIVHRHEGFMDKASIVRVLSRMGVKK